MNRVPLSKPRTTNSKPQTPVPPRLVAGGQGRYDADVSNDGVNMFWIALGIVLLALAVACGLKKVEAADGSETLHSRTGETPVLRTVINPAEMPAAAKDATPEADFKKLEQATYAINLFDHGTNLFGMGHAFAVKEAPGFLVSAAHVFCGKDPHGRIIPLWDGYVYDAEPGHGKHLAVCVHKLDLINDLALLRIVKGKPAHSIELGAMESWKEARLVTNIGKDARVQAPAVVMGFCHDSRVGSGKCYITAFEAIGGMSGSPIIQDGKLAGIVQLGGKGSTCGLGVESIKTFITAETQSTPRSSDAKSSASSASPR